MGTKHGSGKFISLSQCSSASDYGLPVERPKLFTERQEAEIRRIVREMTHHNSPNDTWDWLGEFRKDLELQETLLNKLLGPIVAPTLPASPSPHPDSPEGD